LGQKKNRQVIKSFPNETGIKKMIVKSKREKSGGIIVKVLGDKRKQYLKDRTLYDRSTASLRDVPFILRYRIKK
jgi:hypothetical protein